MDINVKDFLIKYETELIPELYDVPLEQTIIDKKEFWSLRLPKYENKPENPGQLMKHQLILQRFLSDYTPYDEILLLHEPGTGKTCSTVGIIEGCLRNKLGFKKALILAKGKPILDNYLNELVFVCTDGRYIPEDYEKLTQNEKNIRMRKKAEEFYEFNTFQIFAKRLAKMSDTEIKRQYEGTIIVIDEVHNLRRGEDEEGVIPYNEIWKFLHLLENRKIILASATPMKDMPYEISDVMNLILPAGENNQLPFGKEFATKFLYKDGDYYFPKPIMEDALAQYFRGRVSYIKSQESDIKRKFVGKLNDGMKYFITDAIDMQPFQQEYYDNAIALDTQSGKSADGKTQKREGLYNNSRQASLFVFPDGSWGPQGFKKYVTSKKRKDPLALLKNKVIHSYSLNPELQNIFANQSPEEMITTLSQFSCKYAQIISRIISSKDKSHFVYVDLVEGSGAIIFTLMLKLFGFRPAKGGETSPGLRYGLLTATTSTAKQIKEIVRTFNQPENKNGDIIKVIIGSSVVSEGLSFKNVQGIHIATPHWNYSETEQAIGRGLRLFSHVALGPNVVVRIYQYIAQSTTDSLSIDGYMYRTSEIKDVSIKHMERLIKTVAVDCVLNKKRNIRNSPGQRPCDYMECDYDCMYVDVENRQSDLSSYNPLYSSETIKAIANDILNLLKLHNKISIESFRSLYPKYTTYEIMGAVVKLINDNSRVRNNMGLIGWVKEEGGIIYLSPEFSSVHSLSDNYYINRPFFYTQKDLKKVEDELFTQNIPKIIDKLVVAKSLERFREIINDLPLNVQAMFLESAIIAQERNIQMNKDFRKRLLEFFEPYVKKYEQTIVHTLLTPILRCHEEGSGTWDDCDENLGQIIKQQKEELKENLEQNEFGYYGIFNKTKNEFRIRDVSSEEAIQAKKKSKQTRGKVCKFYDAKDLIKMVHTFEIEFDGSEVDKLNKNKLIELAFTTKYKAAGQAFDKADLTRMSEKELRRIIYWSGKNKPAICNAIQKLLEERQLIQVE